jgi:hypothetical protein
MPNTSKAARRLAHEQALASTRIEGHQPSPEFLADCEAVIEGTMTLRGGSRREPGSGAGQGRRNCRSRQRVDAYRH